MTTEPVDKMSFTTEVYDAKGKLAEKLDEPDVSIPEALPESDRMRGPELRAALAGYLPGGGRSVCGSATLVLCTLISCRK